MNIISKLGKYGSDQIADTVPLTGVWCAIQMHEDTVFATLTSSTRAVHGTVTGKVYKAGTFLFGNFTAITLTSGHCEAYIAGSSP